jgi:hypothetical protein
MIAAMSLGEISSGPSTARPPAPVQLLSRSSFAALAALAALAAMSRVAASITLPVPFARRIEDGSLVLWRPGLTLWILAFNNDQRESQADRLASTKNIMSPKATSVREDAAAGLTRLTYRLLEDGVKSVTAIIIGDAGHLQASIYFDEEADAATALRIAQSIAATKPR